MRVQWNHWTGPLCGWKKKVYWKKSNCSSAYKNRVRQLVGKVSGFYMTVSKMGITDLKQAVRINQELDAPAPHSWVMGADKGRSGFPAKQKPALRNAWGMLSLGFCLPNHSPSWITLRSSFRVLSAALLFGGPLWT